MQVSIITLNYKKKELTINCLESLISQYRDELNSSLIEIIIVDNNSQDDSVEFISQYIKKINLKNIQLVTNNENSGFGTGNNLGAKNAKGKYLLFLNNDTIVHDKGILLMADFLSQLKDTAIVGGPLLNSDGTPQPSVSKFYTPVRVFMLLLGMQKAGLIDKNPDNISEVDWVKGALFMIKKNIFEQLKGFDENIFMYTEDMELCYRANKAGYKIYFYPYLDVTHKEHASSNRTFAIINIYKGLLYFYKKHHNPFEYQLVKFVLKLKALILFNIGKVSGNNYFTSTYGQALKVS